jgi:hypothetical protein
MARQLKKQRYKSPYRSVGRNTVETNPFSRGSAGNFIRQGVPEDQQPRRGRRRHRSRLS